MDVKMIIQCIEQEKAVLVLGPDIMFNNKKMLLKEFSIFLQSKELEHKFNDDEELFSSVTRFSPYIFLSIKEFFKSLKVSEIHEKIAEIPFHLIISLSPDLFLNETFEKKGFDKAFKYYNKAASQEDINKPTKQKPLLYNLMGTYKEFKSMVLCFNHLFDYLASIFGVNGLPTNLRSELHEAQTIFFLGFKYDKWYFKLIMRLLNKDDDVIRHASFMEIEKLDGLINFYTDEFKFKFIKDLNGYEIIDAIHKHFKEKNNLRQPMSENNSNQSNSTNIVNVTGNNNIVVQDNKGNLNIDKR